jgi:phage-related protein
MEQKQRQLIYLGSSQKDGRKLPPEVQEVFSYALDVALKGGQHEVPSPSQDFTGVV